jgi:hypothetical protein
MLSVKANIPMRARRVPQEWLRRYGHLVKDVIFYFLDEQKQTLEKLN